MAMPLSVSFTKDEGEILDLLLDIHKEKDDDRPMADITFNGGRIWQHSRYFPQLRLDLLSMPDINLRANNCALPLKSDSLSAVVYDPPHLAGKPSGFLAGSRYSANYGLLTMADNGDHNIGYTFPPVVSEVKRTLGKGGLFIAKIADIIAFHSYQWQSGQLVMEAQKQGLFLVDVLIRVDTNKHKMFVNYRQKYVKHLKKAHVYWLCFRKGYQEVKHGSWSVGTG